MKAAFSCDWFELFCSLESQSPLVSNGSALDIGEFSSKVRDYGTRVYKYVRDVSYNGTSFCIICHEPLSKMSQGGIMRDGMCHVKLANYWLYTDVWYDILIHALRLFDINPIKPSRIDLACDWQNAQCGIYAADLMTGLMHRKYLKVHQPSWRVNGTDAAKLSWHSMAFGSKGSAVFTRFYNKTLELQTTGKDYIRESWKLAGLNLQRDVYRVEFQLEDTGLQFSDEVSGEVYDIEWQRMADRSYISTIFCHYAQHYFDIRKAGTAAKRTDCKTLAMFPTDGIGFIPVQRPRALTTIRTDRIVIRQMIVALFALNSIDERRAMFNSIKAYCSVRESSAMCKGSYRLLLDALYSEHVIPDRIADECFEMAREHYEMYDRQGQWVYDSVEDTREYKPER